MSDVISQMGSLAEAFLPKHAAKLSKKFKTLFIETLILYVVMQKTNFTQLGTFGTANEKTYRSHFEKGGVDMVSFNLELAKQYFEDSIGIKALAIDPSYIGKTGKHTPGLGYFWSGVAGKAKWGLEILGVGIIDTFRHDCVMLGGFQSPNSSMLSSEMVDKAGVPTRHIVGSEAVTDMEHVKATVGDVPVKRPYHKAADAKAIADGNPDETEKAKQSGIPYSISNLKTLAHGQYLMNRFICVSGISADSDLIAKLNEEVFSLTTMQYDIAA